MKYLGSITAVLLSLSGCNTPLAYVKVNRLAVSSAATSAKSSTSSTSANACLAACNAANSATFGGGTGTALDPFRVCSKAHLVRIHTDFAIQNQFTSKYFAQCADIDISGSSWTPIGGAAGFQGTYDGNSKTISGLTITDSELDHVGLFAYLGASAVIKNLILSSVSISRSAATQTLNRYLGSLAGESSGIIDNVTASGSITASNDCNAVGLDYVAGGLIGSVSAGQIKNSQSSVSVSVDNQTLYFYPPGSCYGGSVRPPDGYAGGITGKLSGGILDNNLSSGVVKSQPSGPQSVSALIRFGGAGGIAGLLIAGTSQIKNSIFTGDLVSDLIPLCGGCPLIARSYLGGIAGLTTGGAATFSSNYYQKGASMNFQDWCQSDSTASCSGNTSTLAISFFTQPSVAGTANIDLSTQPILQINDKFGLKDTADSSSIVKFEGHSDSSCKSLVVNGITPSLTSTGITAASGMVYVSGLKVLKTSVKRIKATMGTKSICSNTDMSISPSSASSTFSTITGTGPNLPNGTYASTISIHLEDDFNNLISGVIPTFSASGSGNSYGVCTATDSGGSSTCSMTSTISETKTLSIVSPTTITGGTVVFDSSLLVPPSSVGAPSASDWYHLQFSFTADVVGADHYECSFDGGTTWYDAPSAGDCSYTYTGMNQSLPLNLPTAAVQVRGVTISNAKGLIASGSATEVVCEEYKTEVNPGDGTCQWCAAGEYSPGGTFGFNACTPLTFSYGWVFGFDTGGVLPSNAQWFGSGYPNWQCNGGFTEDASGNCN